MIKKSAIVIYTYHPKESMINDILCGIEEEGGIVEVIEQPMRKTAEELAKEASKQSIIGVGFGISNDCELYFNTQIGLTQIDFGYITIKELGQNAVKYVKNNPFIIEGYK